MLKHIIPYSTGTFIAFAVFILTLNTFTEWRTPKIKNLENQEKSTRILSSDHLDGGNLVVLYISVSIFIGAIFKELHKKFKIPYTALLVILGFLVGYFSDSIPIYGEAVDIISKMEPLTLLMVFIPGLVFNSAYNIDGYITKKSKWQLMLLAGPILLCTGLIFALLLKYPFFYGDITFAECAIIGCILSSTDPVAIVDLIKNLGSPIKFNTLLEGESLFNDGTALIAVDICLKFFIYKEKKAYEVILILA